MKMYNKVRFISQWAFIFILIYGLVNRVEAQELIEKNACTFIIGAGSSYSGAYVVEFDESEAYGYNDFENEQFVIEIMSNNDISIILILEHLSEGKHTFSMEMQVSIDISVDGGENFVNFSNYKEEGGGYIEIEKIDKENNILSGSFSGTFHEDIAPEGMNVEINGKFHVSLE